MVTYYRNEEYEVNHAEGVTSNKYMIQIACKSTDTKPTADIVSGSLALEVDTGDIYAFDGEDWNKITNND